MHVLPETTCRVEENNRLTNVLNWTVIDHHPVYTRAYTCSTHLAVRELVFGQRGRRGADLVTNIALVLAWSRRVRLHVVLQLTPRLA